MTGAARYIHLSNGVTYLSILAGLLAIVAAREARSWSLAGALIAISAAAPIAWRRSAANWVPTRSTP